MAPVRPERPVRPVMYLVIPVLGTEARALPVVERHDELRLFIVRVSVMKDNRFCRYMIYIIIHTPVPLSHTTTFLF